jgi:hypothetical protein
VSAHPDPHEEAALLGPLSDEQAERVGLLLGLVRPSAEVADAGEVE